MKREEGWLSHPTLSFLFIFPPCLSPQSPVPATQGAGDGAIMRTANCAHLVFHGLFLKTWFCVLPAGRKRATKSTKDTKEPFFVVYVPFVANINGLHRSCPCPNPLPTNTSPIIAYTKAASAGTTKPLLQPACVRWRFRKRPCLVFQTGVLPVSMS